ncbi:transposase [Paucilactobacillus hokkaidonensis]|nr:transposase [Paucilactobacillus hokkaidonensis]
MIALGFLISVRINYRICHTKKEFKQSLVEMHNQGRSYTDLSAEYGPSVDSIRNWVKLYAVHEVDGEKWTQADVNALQKENDKLREELEILKRAAVLLSKYN